MRFYRKASLKVAVATELLRFFAENKHWWLQPILLILFLFGVLIVIAQSSAIAPFIYALY